jgi:hypothetical protein
MRFKAIVIKPFTAEITLSINKIGIVNARIHRRSTYAKVILAFVLAQGTIFLYISLNDD